MKKIFKDIVIISFILLNVFTFSYKKINAAEYQDEYICYPKEAKPYLQSVVGSVEVCNQRGGEWKGNLCYPKNPQPYSISVVGSEEVCKSKNIDGEWRKNPNPTETIGSRAGGAIKAMADIGSNLALGLFAKTVLYPIFSVANWIMTASGSLLDYTIDKTILEFGEDIKSMTGINIAWELLRNLINISFIFILLYESFMSIFTERDKIIPTVTSIITAAILVNFSLFFTKVIIDTSNIAAVFLYNSIVGTDGSISMIFERTLHISSIFDGVDGILSNGRAEAIAAILGTILVLIISVIFFAISILFIVRYVAFIFLLVASPFGVASSIIPGTSDWGKKYWSILKNQAIWPVGYFLLTWIIVTIMSSPGFIIGSTGQVGFASFVQQPYSNSEVSMLINYIAVISMVIASLKYAKSLATTGDDKLNSVFKYSAGAVAGGLSLAGTQVVGRVGNKLANSEGLKEKAAGSGFGSFASRQLLKASNSASKSQFDMRNTSAFDYVSKGAGVNFGKAGEFLNLENVGKGGFVEQSKRLRERNGFLGTGLFGTQGDVDLARQVEVSDEIKKEAEKKLKENKEKFELEKAENADKVRKGYEEALKELYLEAKPSIEAHRKARKEHISEEAKLKKIKADLDNLEPRRDEDVQKLDKATDELALLRIQFEGSTDEKERENIKDKIQKKEKRRKSLQDKISQADERLAEIAMYKDVATLQEAEEKVVELKSVSTKAEAEKNLKLKDYNKKQAERDAEIENFLSEEEKQLIAQIGGQEEKKDEYGNVKQKEVGTRGQQYLNQRVEKLSGKGVLNNLFLRSADKAKVLKEAKKKLKENKDKK